MANQNTDLADRILDKALELAEACSWEELRLHTVADELTITLDEIRQCFPQKDDLVEAWFDRADKAVLTEPQSEDFLEQTPPERLHKVIMTWLVTLAPHRRITREMLMYKLEPGHIHLQALGIMRISRTVQWFREAACQETTNLQRILEEISLTVIYLGTFARWLFDETPESTHTQQHLKKALHQWDKCGNKVRKHFCTPVNPRQKTKEPGPV